MVFGIFFRNSAKKREYQNKEQFLELKKTTDLKYADLRELILGSKKETDSKINDFTHALCVLDEDIVDIKQKMNSEHTQNNPQIPQLQQHMAVLENKINLMHQNQKDLMIFGKLAIQNHEHEMGLNDRMYMIEQSIKNLSKTQIFSEEQLTNSVNLPAANLTNSVNLTKLNQKAVNFENDGSEYDENTKPNQSLTKSGLVKLTKPSLVKFSLVKFSKQNDALAPQEKQILFYLYNVQADRQVRAITIKSIVEGMYDVADQSKTSYISRSVKKMEDLGLTIKQRTGKSTSVWLTKNAIDYCRTYMIERFENK
ncbi:MAG: hypothetical protein KAI53_00680 [Candidatus Aenigmarchaeota archaeon]|nr:hypothetical protein [Candidatus Aenigmarchaeota archaeon]